MKEQEEKLRIITEEFQDECHRHVDVGISVGAKGTYQDLTNVWLFQKLAQLQLQIIELKTNK